MLEHSHNIILVLASFAIAVMAGFTGLSLTKGASAIDEWRRKVVVAMSAMVLGSGIWSMHFVAMLGMRLSVPFHYDALTTLISALVAILLTGLALLVVHFGERTPQRIALAGVFTGFGIVAMHYLGMSGIQNVQPVYSVMGVSISLVSSLTLCVISFFISYGNRENRNILFGTLGFGVSVVCVHYVAMAGTHFIATGDDPSGFSINNDVLAFGVTFSSFVISGAFLLVGVTFAQGNFSAPVEPQHAPIEPAPAPQAEAESANHMIPYERDGMMHFVPDEEVYAVRAEGHYTFVYHALGRLFCPWSISDFEKRGATGHILVQCHRSYLVNPGRVASFERKKDNGVCHFEEGAPIEKLPVSRSYLKDIRELLGV